MEIANDGRLKICWMRIVGFQQFQDVFLDFTHPETGEPLDKICLIGANGTGKTVVLEMINDMLLRLGINKVNDKPIERIFYLVVFRLQIEKSNFLIWSTTPSHWNTLVWTVESEGKFLKASLENGKLLTIENLFHQPQASIFRFNESSNSLLINIPAEEETNPTIKIDDVPRSNLGTAINIGKKIPVQNVVSNGSVETFWALLIFHLHQREEARKRYEFLEENFDKSKRQLVHDFDSKYPNILESISTIWNRVLDKAGLKFDIDEDKIKIPFLSTDNLHAYVTTKTATTTISYNRLSTGIRAFIFRLGHIFSLYFDREIKRGFLLVDEPENGLFPDFLYDLVDFYRQTTTDKNGENNTQMFFATHEPIIAAQFEPDERIILEWNDDGTVRTRKGVAPIGDDPNDLLRKDFAVASLMGREGLEAWKRYLFLRDQLGNGATQEERETIANEYLDLGMKYSFPAR